MSKDRQKIKITSARSLMKKFDHEPTHAKQVTRLALQLFDALQILHGFGQNEKAILEAAALLHDIGWSEGRKGHHKTCMKLILKNDLPGWNDDEKILIANVARYHRKSLPNDSHKNYAILNEKEKSLVRKLASLLRIADSLDRSHTDAVDTIEAQLGSDTVNLSLAVRGEIATELYGFEKKRDLFAEAFALPIVIDKIRNVWDNNE